MKNLELNEQEQLNQQKATLLDDLLSVDTVMEEIWSYHPENPSKKDIVEQYNILKRIKSTIEEELKELG